MTLLAARSLSTMWAMPSVVQDVLIEWLAELEDARDVSAAVRVMSGTTVSLLDRVVTGTFAERLFYRLNIIHLLPPGDRPIDPA
jgi:DNA-binding NtrC family response regulator